MAALDLSNSCTEHGRFDHENPCLLVKEINLAENAEEKSAEFLNKVCQVTLEAFWTQNVKGEEGFDRTDSMLEGLGA